MQGPAGSSPPVLSFLELVFCSLPFQIKKFGLRNPGYPQIPKPCFTKKWCASRIRNRAPPHQKINCLSIGAVAVPTQHDRPAARTTCTTCTTHRTWKDGQQLSDAFSLLQLGLDVDNHQPKERALQLHGADRLGKPLLLRRE